MDFQNEDGIIFINQTAVPSSNIYEIFPFLYKSHKPKSVPGLIDFVSKLIEMGLQDYILLKSQIIDKKNDTARNVSQNNDPEKWWFLN
jgi:hypothetical protein